MGKFWLERFSPYFMRPHQYGVRITGPGLAYEYVYDARQVDLMKIAYDFEYELEDWQVDSDVYQELVDAVHEWQRRYASDDKPFLYYSKAMRYVTVYDGRNPGSPTRERFDWPASFIIEYCNEAPKSAEQIRGALQAREPQAGDSADAIAALLAQLTAKRIMYEEKGKYLTLAIPEHPFL